MTTPVDSDRLNSVSSTKIAKTAMTVIDAIQSEPKEVQVAALACVFTMVVERYGLHAGNALDVAQRLIEASVKERTDLRAVRMYVNEELKHG